jgi:hypothetical protein
LSLSNRRTVATVGRAERATLRPIAVPFVVAPPAGVRIRTGLRLTDSEAVVLRQVGEHLGRLYRADLAARIRLGDVGGGHTDRAGRKRGLTVHSTSRWAGAITRTVEDQYQLAMRSLRADVDTLARAIRALDSRIAAPVAGQLGQVRGYQTQAERAMKQRRRAVLAGRLEAARRRLASGRPTIVSGGRRLVKPRHNLAVADLGLGRWRQHWDATRMLFRRTVASIPTGGFRSRLTGMAHTAGLPVIAVDPAYTSRWGARYRHPVLQTRTPTATRHHAPAVAIARRANRFKARRRLGVTRTRPEDRDGRATSQAESAAVGVWKQPALARTARTTLVDKDATGTGKHAGLPHPEDRSREPGQCRRQCAAVIGHAEERLGNCS